MNTPSSLAILALLTTTLAACKTQQGPFTDPPQAPSSIRPFPLRMLPGAVTTDFRLAVSSSRTVSYYFLPDDDLLMPYQSVYVVLPPGAPMEMHEGGIRAPDISVSEGPVSTSLVILHGEAVEEVATWPVVIHGDLIRSVGFANSVLGPFGGEFDPARSRLVIEFDPSIPSLQAQQHLRGGDVRISISWAQGSAEATVADAEKRSDTTWWVPLQFTRTVPQKSPRFWVHVSFGGDEAETSGTAYFP